MATNFMKTNESTVVETIYEAIVDDISYNFNVRRVNGDIASVVCNIVKNEAYIGGMYQQNGQKSMNIQQGEDAQPHVAVFEEFLGTLAVE